MARSPIIIPGQTLPGREIFVPKEAMPTYRCTVTTGPGEECGAPFYEDELSAFLRHVKACAAEHRDEIHEASPRKRMPAIYDRNLWDPEYEDYMARVGARMEAEGRLEQHRNEH